MNVDCESGDFTAIDSVVVTAGELSDEDIAASVRETDPSTDDTEDPLEDDGPVSVPTYSEYTSAVDVVKRFMICMSSGHRDMVAVRTLEQFMFTTRREMQQTALDRFLQVS